MSTLLAPPRLLDLFCGAGGAAMGYHQAGFDVVGVDIAPQPHYPFEFHHADALDFPLDGYDAVHASPPCQLYSEANNIAQRNDHPDLLGPIRERLQAACVPWVIENVPGAPMRVDVLLCGSMFGLRAGDFGLVRHLPHVPRKRLERRRRTPRPALPSLNLPRLEDRSPV